MKRLRAIFPSEFSKNPAHWRAMALGAVYLSLAIAQLFTFEKFYEVTYGYGFAGGLVTAAFLAGLIVALEVASLPYLLSMKLDPRAWRVTKSAAVATGVLWLGIALFTNISGNADSDTGLFGVTIPTLNGLWFVVFTAIMLWAALLVARELPRRK